MFNILGLFSENIVAIIIVFVVLIFIIAYLFAKDKFGSMITGIFRIVVSFFYSPFIYMKNAVLTLAEYGSKGETEFSHSKQYLLNKLLLSLQAILVVFAIAVLASSLVVGWNQMMPPKELRLAITQMEESIKKQRDQLSELDTQADVKIVSD